MMYSSLGPGTVEYEVLLNGTVNSEAPLGHRTLDYKVLLNGTVNYESLLTAIWDSRQ
jgi:hypothetical protein